MATLGKSPPRLPAPLATRGFQQLEMRDRLKKEMIERVLNYFVELAKPFYYMLLATEVRVLSKEEAAARGIPLAATDGERIFINEGFLEELSHFYPERQLAGVIAHELLHIFLQHIERGKSRERMIWNIATDALINETLRNGPCDLTILTPLVGPLVTFEILEDITGISRDHFKNLDAEDIYNVLIKKAQEDAGKKKGGKDLGGAPGRMEGDLRDDLKEEDIGETVHKPVIERDKDVPLEEWKERVFSRAIQSAGSEAGRIKRLFENFIKRKHQIDWKTRLRLLLTQGLTKRRRSFNRPHRRGVAELPGRRTLDPLPVYVLVDTSGSIGSNIMEHFAAEIYSIVGDIAPVYVIPWDTEAYGVFRARTKNDLMKVFNEHLKGGGGTDPIPAIRLVGEWVMRTGASAVILLTDGFWSTSDDSVAEAVRSKMGSTPFLVAYTDREPVLPGIEKVKLEVRSEF